MSDSSSKHAGLSAEVIEMPIGREVRIEHLEYQARPHLQLGLREGAPGLA